MHVQVCFPTYYSTDVNTARIYYIFVEISSTPQRTQSQKNPEPKNKKF